MNVRLHVSLLVVALLAGSFSATPCQAGRRSPRPARKQAGEEVPAEAVAAARQAILEHYNMLVHRFEDSIDPVTGEELRETDDERRLPPRRGAGAPHREMSAAPESAAIVRDRLEEGRQKGFRFYGDPVSISGLWFDPRVFAFWSAGAAGAKFEVVDVVIRSITLRQSGAAVDWLEDLFSTVKAEVQIRQLPTTGGVRALYAERTIRLNGGPYRGGFHFTVADDAPGGAFAADVRAAGTDTAQSWLRFESTGTRRRVLADANRRVADAAAAGRTDLVREEALRAIRLHDIVTTLDRSQRQDAWRAVTDAEITRAGRYVREGRLLDAASVYTDLARSYIWHNPGGAEPVKVPDTVLAEQSRYRQLAAGYYGDAGKPGDQVGTIRAEGELAERRGLVDEAVGLYRRSVDMTRTPAALERISSIADRARARVARGLRLRGWNVKDARENLSLEEFDELSDDVDAAHGLHDLRVRGLASIGDALAEAGRHDEAIAAYRECLDARRDIEDSFQDLPELVVGSDLVLPDEAAVVGLVRSLLAAGAFLDAEVLVDATMSDLEASGGMGTELAFGVTVGAEFASRAACRPAARRILERAISLLDAGVEVVDDPFDDDFRETAEFGLGLLALSRGDIGEAGRRFDRIVESGDPDWTEADETGLGSTGRQLLAGLSGNDEAVLMEIEGRHADNKDGALGSSPASALVWIAEREELAGNTTMAATCSQLALEAALAAADSGDCQVARYDVFWRALAANDLERALEQARDIVAGADGRAGDWPRLIGRDLFTAGYKDASVPYLRQAVESTSDDLPRALALVKLAAAVAERDPATALTLVEEADGLDALLEAVLLTPEFHRLRGRCLVSLGRTHEAASEFTKAIEAWERVEAALPGSAFPGKRLTSADAGFSELAALLADGGDARAALSVAERARARLEPVVDISRLATVAERERLERHRHDFVEARKRSDHGAAHDDGREARRTYVAYAEYLARKYSGRKESAAARALTADRIEAAIPDGGAIVEYAVLENRTIAFVVTTDVAGAATVRAVDLAVTQDSLARQVAEFRAAVGTYPPRYDVTALGGELYRQLILPLEGALGSRRRLVIVPDRSLASLPFQCLWRDGRYLAEDFTISYAPSISALADVTSRHAPVGRKYDVVAFDAVGSSQDRRTSSRQGLPAVVDGLPRPLVVGRATEQSVRQNARHGRIVHLRAHGVLDRDFPSRSFLAMEESGDDDGYMEMAEMASHGSAADLVVLEACDSGVGAGQYGEHLSMAWAVLLAGSRAGLVSQWQVPRDSTAGLMTSFYDRLAALHGKFPDATYSELSATALRDAMVASISTPGREHPYFWGGFVAIGAAQQSGRTTGSGVVANNHATRLAAAGSGR